MLNKSTAQTATATTNSSAAPSNPLQNENGNSFILFNHNWLRLQSFVAGTLQLPITKGDFTQKYGAFSDKNQVESCITNLEAINNLANTMGDPSTLQQKIIKNPNYVSGPTPPAEIYAHCIWLAGQINNVASTYHYTYRNLSDIYTRSPQKNAAAMREIISGDGGMLAQAKQMKQYTNDLQNKLSTFQSKFATAEQGVQTYFDNDLNVLNAAIADIKTDENDIATLKAKAKEAHEEWEKYTIAATTTSVGVMVLSAGLLWPVAAGLGGGLGAAAADEMSLYNKYMGEIANDQADLKKKNQLVLDLTSFNTSVANVSTLTQKFATDLATIEGVWLDQNQQLTNIINLDDAILGNLSELVEKRDIAQACNDWKTIATNTENFITKCLVTYLTSTQFPNPIPTNN